MTGIIVGLHTTDEHGEDPAVLMPPLPVEARAIPGGMSQQAQEDLQVLSFLLAVTVRGGGKHPLAVTPPPGGDPPDRVLKVANQSWGVELTELTITDVRRELARVRSAGRRVDEAIRLRPAAYTHLLGRNVSLMVTRSEDVAVADTPGAAADVARVLLDDKGYVGEGMDTSAGLPAQWGEPRGFYGKHGGCIVQVHGGGAPGAVQVTASAQSEIRRSEALGALRERVDAKDLSPNDLLLVTCGLPDQKGFSCPLDLFIFQALVEARQHGRLLAAAPKQLSGIALHYWPTGDWIEVWRRPGQDPPWA